MKSSNYYDKKRYFITIFGVVQGVGYRPYVYNTAKSLNIKGWVSNHGSALVIDVEGEKQDIKKFLLQIIKRPPKLAYIEKIVVFPKEYIGQKDFDIKKSSLGNKDIKFIAEDVATCPDCLNDIFNPKNSRYNYAFTNCTACGPRYSIIKGLPYDRENTTMETFRMCPICENEYLDPTNRRFHAQPNCCSNCGPSLELLNSKVETITCEDPVKATIDLIKQGKIIAIKGIGGFHLACDGKNKKAIEKLRKRKNRPHKPFAIMVKDLETARQLANISKEEEKILVGNKKPILILNKKESCVLPELIAPNTRKIGIMLPYTPLHYLLFQEDIYCLIMTSGNLSGGPIQYENNKALENLKNIAEYFLIHNRDINTPVEDSVVKIIDGREVIVRRARGYTPYTINMKVNNEIIAFGAEQKNTFCLSKNGYGYMSQYLGDLKDYEAYSNYLKAIDNLISILELRANVSAYDLHFKYLGSEFQVERKIPIQHHHAHMVSCMAEHNIYAPVLGVIYDGTGLGTDGTIWGGEFLLGTRDNFFRVGHLKYVTIQGGNQSVKEPWRVALSYLRSIDQNTEEILKEIEKEEMNIVKKGLEQQINCYRSSSIGRLFDCIASLLNIRHRITYDAQGAIELENIIDPTIKEGYDFNIKEEDDEYLIEYNRILEDVLKDISKGIPASTISTKFHNTIVNTTVDVVSRIRERYRINRIVLSGGVFENNYLLKLMLKQLNERNFTVYYNQQIPTNDSGISVGQLAIADAIEGK